MKKIGAKKRRRINVMIEFMTLMTQEMISINMFAKSCAIIVYDEIYLNESLIYDFFVLLASVYK